MMKPRHAGNEARLRECGADRLRIQAVFLRRLVGKAQHVFARAVGDDIGRLDGLVNDVGLLLARRGGAGEEGHGGLQVVEGTFDLTDEWAGLARSAA